MNTQSLKICKTVRPEKPTKNINEWVKHLISLGCVLSCNSNYNQKETQTLKLRSN